MNNNISTVRGMHDLIGDDYYRLYNILDIFINEVELFNFTPISTPIMEHSQVFQRTLGDSSDVVMKEMYSLFDKSNESLTLRPEGTAGIARAIISNGLTQELPKRYYYHGPMFRYERPQKGRLRQFNQVGVELFGKGDFFEDCEIIRLAYFFLKKLNLIDNLSLKINTIGSNSSRKIFLEKIKEYFKKYKDNLSLDSLKRLDKNPLRILDSKDPEDKKLLKDAPVIFNFLKEEEIKNFENIKSLLDDMKISYNVDPHLVRGLDYYSDTTFEFTLNDNDKFAILAGGRYNNLVKELGGSKIPGIGWAAGMERLASLTQVEKKSQIPIILIPADRKYLNYIFSISSKLYSKNIKNQILDNLNIKKSLKYANKIKAEKALIVGEEEFNNSLVSYKNLISGEQVSVDERFLFEKLKYE